MPNETMSDLSYYFHELRMKLLGFINADNTGDSVESIKEQLLGFYGSYNVIVANLESATVYRVRKIDPGTAHVKCADVWHPPPECITKINRANDIGQAMFYCSLDPRTAIEEAQIRDGDEFSLAVYRLKGRTPYDMRSIVIKEARPLSGNGAEYSIFGAELSKFMVNEFTRPVAKGSEHHYKRSCAISQILLDLPYKDSLIYPSVRNSESINVVYTSEAAAERFTLSQVATCMMGGESAVTVTKLWLPDSSGNLIAQSPGHPMPAPLRLTGSTLRFSDSFHDSNIVTPDEIIQYHLANKAFERMR